MQKRKIVLNIIFIIIILLLVYFVYKTFNTFHDNKDIKKEIEKIKEEVVIVKQEDTNPQDNSSKQEEVNKENSYVQEELTLDFQKLKSINSDTVGWIKVSNTNINYPIVRGKDNSYYLSHSFYKEKNINGWIFENSVNSVNFDDDNTVLFGHNTNGNTMFSELKNIYNGLLGTNIDITIYLENNTINYKVFSVYLENPNNTSNISEYLNEDILNEMINNSKLQMDNNVTIDDKILTLSTCNNVTEDRIIVHAKKV